MFNTRANSVTNFDTISDFSILYDRIWLDYNVFTALGATGPLTPSAFWTGTAARKADNQVIYDSAHGVLYYDPDGVGATGQVAVTKILTGLEMTYADIFVV
ncbi:hypothetical protein AA309_16605 [Microvirga vignae]|uniref:Calcium-binding protein n=1 Tax=Microvirga vignae TaxID=1225564 RepID=A0A0H1RA26_9HYPH|nr:hypothetical protein [Microvirga vignae]KLK92043.1 hypothetical protein AA309_16605 [Microvirga vignae]